jgi:hypothetical protein
MTVSTGESDRRLHSVEILMYIPSMGLSGGYFFAKMHAEPAFFVS